MREYTLQILLRLYQRESDLGQDNKFEKSLKQVLTLHNKKLADALVNYPERKESV